MSDFYGPGITELIDLDVLLVDEGIPPLKHIYPAASWDAGIAAGDRALCGHRAAIDGPCVPYSPDERVCRTCLRLEEEDLRS